MKFIFTGPECSGKTTLSSFLIEKFNLGYAPEMARTYLETRNNKYDYNDLLEIAKIQNETSNQVARKYENIVCDTDLLTIIIWSIEKYGKCDSKILKMFHESGHRQYLLCKPDIPWIFDGQRENSFDRDRLYDIYLNRLLEFKLPYTIIQGDLEERKEFLINYFKQILM